MTKLPLCLVVPFRVGIVWGSNIYEVSNMEKKIPQGISVIYLDDKSKSIYADLPPDNEQAQSPSKRIYKNAMTALSSDKGIVNPSTPRG